MKRFRHAFAALSVVLIVPQLVGPTEVGADGATAVAWFWRAQQREEVVVPATASGVPAGELAIGFAGGLAQARTAIELPVGQATSGTLKLHLDAGASQSAASSSIVACASTIGWPRVEAGYWVRQPVFSCSPGVPGRYDAATNTYSFTLDRLLSQPESGLLNLLLTAEADQENAAPAPSPPTAPGGAWTVVVKAPPNGIDLTLDGAPSSALPTPEPTVEEAPSGIAFPGGFIAPDLTRPEFAPTPVSDPVPPLTGLEVRRPSTFASRPIPVPRSTGPRGRWPLSVLVLLVTLGLYVPAQRSRTLHRDALGRMQSARPGEPALEVRGLVVRFGGVQAVSDVSFSVPPGQILGLIGPNGAGKTTILDAITGLVDFSGVVAMSGVDLGGIDTAGRAALGLGRSFQDGRLFPSLTVRETIVVAFEQSSQRVGAISAVIGLGASSANEREVGVRVEALIDTMGLRSFGDKFLSELSTGSRRIVDLACMVAHGASVLLLDEPSSGIAQRETEALGPVLLKLRDQLNCTIVLIEHDMPLITSVADRLIALEVGRIIADGSPHEVVNDARVVEAYLGTDTASVQRSGAAPKAAGR